VAKLFRDSTKLPYGPSRAESLRRGGERAESIAVSSGLVNAPTLEPARSGRTLAMEHRGSGIALHAVLHGQGSGHFLIQKVVGS
jgi:hypothetical protein